MWKYAELRGTEGESDKITKLKAENGRRGGMRVITDRDPRQFAVICRQGQRSGDHEGRDRKKIEALIYLD